VPYKLDVTGTLKSGAPAVPRAIAWRTNSPAAQIDSMGVLTARDTGTFIVAASAGGWRATSDTIRVVDDTAPTLLAECWSHNPLSRWRFFGVPAPIIEHTADADLFLNNGDGSFESGAYALRGFSAASGLSVDVRFSARITAVQWQRLSVSMNAITDTQPLAAWNHRTGWIDKYFGDNRCAFGYPAGEGAGARDRASPIGILRTANGQPLELWKGTWVDVRLQLFPDGRCGIAINGVPYLIQIARGPREPPVYLAIEGASAHTRVLVGDVTVRSGVPAGVDWSKLEFYDGAWRRPRVGHAAAPPQP
jgi:hypothetical protein